MSLVMFVVSSSLLFVVAGIFAMVLCDINEKKWMDVCGKICGGISLLAAVCVASFSISLVIIEAAAGIAGFIWLRKQYA